MTDPRRLVPRTDALLADPRLAPAIERLGVGVVKQAVQHAQQLARTAMITPDEVADAVLAALPMTASSLHPVINASGVVLHTNLGRAALSPAAIAALVEAAGYVDLEYDIETGTRGRRGAPTIAALLARVPVAEAAHVVNNGAAALVLTAAVLAAGREIIVSRGELLEIGDGFRLPELINSSGARVREVGTTNRTNLEDYRAAIGPATGFILKIHPSNFEMTGFTSSVDVGELATLGVAVIADIGSGLLRPDPILATEPDATTWLRAGADLVTASADKLLGGPQAGLILGRAALVQQLRQHPMARALRVDKLTLAALEATLSGPPTPTDLALHADPDALRVRAARIVADLDAAGVPAHVSDSEGVVGGGGAPGLVLPGAAIELPQGFAVALRHGRPCVVGRVEHGGCLLDLRCVSPADDDRLRDAILAAAKTSERSP